MANTPLLPCDRSRDRSPATDSRRSAAMMRMRRRREVRGPRSQPPSRLLLWSLQPLSLRRAQRRRRVNRRGRTRSSKASWAPRRRSSPRRRRRQHRCVRRRSSRSLDVALANHAWGWDTMASSCCSGNRARFIYAAQVRCGAGQGGGRQHRAGDAHRQRAAARGGWTAGKVVRIVIDNVLYHERFSSNLLSSELLTQEAWLAVPQHPGVHVRGDARRAPRDAQHARPRGGADVRRSRSAVMLAQRVAAGRSAIERRRRGRSWCACTRRLATWAGRA